MIGERLAMSIASTPRSDSMSSHCASAFITFREIFEIAKQQNVDGVFLGGDLFDINKPSRETMVRTMEIMQEYCMNDKSVSLEVLSDQTVNFPR